jgi:hypothetical protein
MPCLVDMKIGRLPDAELTSYSLLEAKRVSLETKVSSDTNMTVNLCPLLVKSSVTSVIEVTSAEKTRLKRVANSFSVQVPAHEFLCNPVRSLFSSFAAPKEQDVQ